MSVEGGNTYQDIDASTTYKANLKDSSSIDDIGIGIENTSQDQLDGDEREDTLDIESQVQEMLDMFEESIEGTEIQGFDVFKVFIETSKDPSIKLSLIDEVDSMRIWEVSEASSRLPANEFEFKQSLVEGSVLNEIKLKQEDTELKQEDTELKQEDTELKQEDTELKQERIKALISKSEEYKNKIQNFGDSLDGIDLGDSNLASIIAQIGDLPTDVKSEAQAEKIVELNNALIASLKSSREIEKTILPQALAQGSEVFKRVSEGLISLDGSFKSRIEAFQVPSEFKTLPYEQKSRVSGALGTTVGEVSDKSEKSGNIFTLRNTDGTEVNYDVVLDERSLELDGYSINSQVEDTGDYQTPKLEYTRKEQKHLPIIKLIGDIVEAIEEKTLSVDDFAELKATVGKFDTSSLGIDINNFENGGDFRDALTGILELNQNKLQEARDEYTSTLTEMRGAYMNALKKKDEKVKNTLRFFRAIGFTDIPQYITDQVVETLNSDNALAAQLGFNETIDFENGNLGIDKVAGESDTRIERADMVAFAEFVNKMIGTDAINIASIKSGSGVPIEDRSKFKIILNKSGLLNVGGVGVAMRNLQKNNEIEENNN